MRTQDELNFRQAWPKCFIIFMGIIELLILCVLVLTELGNVASNFWYTNVFAGAWCGLVLFIHIIALFVTGCCLPYPAAAFRALIITIIALLATALLIAFDAVFIAQPYTCILTSSCVTNAASTTLYSYYFQSAFLTVFTSLSPFKTYTWLQAKFLFEAIQLGVGCLAFVLCIIYIIIYYVIKNKASKQIKPLVQQPRAPQPAYSQPAPPQPSYPQQYPGYQQPPPQQQYRQPPPGEVPWNTNRRY